MLMTNPPATRTHADKQAFTLIELLVVISIIAVLAGLAFPAVNGAIASARKAEVRSMASQIQGAIIAYYTEYGVLPANLTKSDSAFVSMMTTTTNTNNLRGIRFLEIPAKFLDGSSNLVTPLKFYKTGQSNFTIVVDTNYDGSITAPDGKPVNASVAVGVKDPTATNWIGTW